MRQEPSKNLIWLMVGMLAIYSLAHMWNRIEKSIGFDYYHYWVVPQILSHQPVPNIYSDEGRHALGTYAAARMDQATTSEKEAAALKACLEVNKGLVDTVSTPFLYDVVQSLSCGDYETDLRRFQLLSLLFFTVSLALLCRALGFSATVTLLAIPFFVLCIEAVWSDGWVANTARLQFGLVAAALVSWARLKKSFGQVIAGALIALAVMLKPIILHGALFLLLLPLVRREYRSLFRVALGFLAGSVYAFTISAIYFKGVDVWFNWFAVLPKLLASSRTLSEWNISATNWLAAGSGLDVSVAVFGLCLALYLAALWRGRKAPEDVSGGRGIAAVALGCLCMLLSGRLIWLHYPVLAIPAILFVTRPVETQKEVEIPQGLAFLALVLMSRLPYIFVPSIPGMHAALFHAGAVIVFGLGLRALWTDDATLLRPAPDNADAS